MIDKHPFVKLIEHSLLSSTKPKILSKQFRKRNISIDSHSKRCNQNKRGNRSTHQHGVVMGSNLRGQSGSDSNESFLFRMVNGGNTVVYIFRRLVGLGAAGVLLYFSYNVYNMQDSQKNAIIGSANSTLDPCK